MAQHGQPVIANCYDLDSCLRSIDGGYSRIFHIKQGRSMAWRGFKRHIGRKRHKPEPPHIAPGADLRQRLAGSMARAEAG